MPLAIRHIAWLIPSPDVTRGCAPCLERSIDRLFDAFRIALVVLDGVDRLVGDLLQDLARAGERRPWKLRLARPEPRAHQRLGALEIDPVRRHLDKYFRHPLVDRERR